MSFNAVTFLAELFKPTPWLRPDGLPADWRDEYEERAAIGEYCGNLPRPEAERRALAEIAGKMGRKKPELGT